MRTFDEREQRDCRKQFEDWQESMGQNVTLVRDEFDVDWVYEDPEIQNEWFIWEEAWRRAI